MSRTVTSEITESDETHILTARKQISPNPDHCRINNDPLNPWNQECNEISDERALVSRDEDIEQRPVSRAPRVLAQCGSTEAESLRVMEMTNQSRTTPLDRSQVSELTNVTAAQQHVPQELPA